MEQKKENEEKKGYGKKALAIGIATGAAILSAAIGYTVGKTRSDRDRARLEGEIRSLRSNNRNLMNEHTRISIAYGRNEGKRNFN